MVKGWVGGRKVKKIERSIRLQEKERGARGAGGAVCCWSYARVWLFGNRCR